MVDGQRRRAFQAFRLGRSADGIPLPHLNALTLAGWHTLPEDFVGRGAAQCGMGPMKIVPSRVLVEHGVHLRRVQRHKNAPEAFGLHRSEEALNDGDASMLANGAEARFDAMALAPCAVVVLKLGAAVGDHVLGRSACGANRCIQERTDVRGGGFLTKRGFGYHRAGEVVQHGNHMPAERPLLNKRVWEPRDPEAKRGGYNGDVNMPEVVGSFGANDAGGARRSHVLVV